MLIAPLKHITEPDKHGYQVRIVRKGVEHSRYFSHSSWGNKAKSLAAAQSWRDQKLVSLGSRIKSMVDRGALTNNKSTGVRGVTKTKTLDKRRGSSYLVYQVHWKEKGVVKNKKFQVGLADKVTADQDIHAFRTAVHFRKAYEMSVLEDLDFNADWYQNWRKERLYDLPIDMSANRDSLTSAA